MAQQIKPEERLAFGGIHFSGNPARRPILSATICKNCRIMPDPDMPWLRLYGGRKARAFLADGAWKQFHEYNDPVYAGWTNHISRHVDAGDVVKWKWFALSNYVVIDILTIFQGYDQGFAINNRTAIANLRNRIVLYNGLGKIDSTGSHPPFVSYDPSINQSMYFGLHPYVPGIFSPTVSTTAGTIDITVRRHVWVGLYSAASGHFSNAVYCGAVTTAADISIVVSDLDRIKAAYFSAYDQGALYYVFYLTPDLAPADKDFMIAYLLLDPADPTSPLKHSILGATSFTITDISGLDVSKERPTLNFPPRPMRWIALVQGRMYGALMQGGNGSTDDFSYSSTVRERTGVVYSLSPSDVLESDIIGNPEECWPPDNRTEVPTSEVPIWGMAAPDGYRLVVWTRKGCYLIEEEADGIHTWTACKSGPDEGSNFHGLSTPDSIATSPHGVLFVTQRNQVARLLGESVQILSDAYQPLLLGKTVRCCTYTLDPINYIDRYEIYLTDGTAIIHDFAAGGEGYTVTGVPYTAAATLFDFNSVAHHLVANSSIYTQAGQPEDGLEKVRVETFDGVGQVQKAGVTGEWQSQWLDYGDPGLRKNIGHMDVTGDVERLEVDWYINMDEAVVQNRRGTARHELPQEGPGNMRRRFKLASATAHRFKLFFKLTGPNQDSIDTYPSLDKYGDAPESTRLLGSVTAIDTTVAALGQNRS